MANLVFEGSQPFGKEEAMPEGYDKSKVTTLEDIKKYPKPVLGALAMGGAGAVGGGFLGHHLWRAASNRNLANIAWKQDPTRLEIARTMLLSNLPKILGAGLGLGGLLLGWKLFGGRKEVKEPEPAL